MFTSLTPTSAVPAFCEEYTKGVAVNVKASPPVGEDPHIIAGVPDVVPISKLLACLLSVGVFHVLPGIVADVFCGSSSALMLPSSLSLSSPPRPRSALPAWISHLVGSPHHRAVLGQPESLMCPPPCTFINGEYTPATTIARILTRAPAFVIDAPL